MTSAALIDIPLDRIVVSRRNPRKRLGGLQELADSIREYGLLHPVVARPRGADADGVVAYELIAGHRRLEAVRNLGWTHVPAVLRTVDVDDAYLLTLVENLQREDLSPREESQALEVLVRERGWSTRQVAAAVKRSQSYVSRRLRVFDDPVVGPLVVRGELGVSVAEELLPLPGQRKRDLALLAVEQGWDRQHVRRVIQDAAQGRPSSRAASLLSQTRAFRQALRNAVPSKLTESERRELRLTFQELAMLAKAPTEERRIVFPPLPIVARGRRR